MTYVAESLSVPAHMSFEAEPLKPGESHDVKLPVPGQGTIGFAAEKTAFRVTIKSGLAGAPAFRWDVDSQGARLSEYSGETWHELASAGPQAALDPEDDCIYWFSVDCRNRALIYGKGEMRLGTAVAKWPIPRKPDVGTDRYAWTASIDGMEIDAEMKGEVDVWRDPVAVEPPMWVVGHDEIAMDDIAAGLVTVAANLTPRCQQLYDAVAGARFQLDTPDFREFSAAIKASIANPAGWCFQTLKNKADEFGSDQPDATYLRITLGINQGESPGIPYVMEIWPSGHYSPIHDHGGADAVIKVLHGQIKVMLYPMLSLHHQVPFAEKRFDKGDVTWISARLNQVHKLQNDHEDPCITIQCYMYDETDLTHWPYFDYLEDKDIGRFDPNSDATFEWFKAKMKAEWENPPALTQE